VALLADAPGAHLLAAGAGGAGGATGARGHRGVGAALAALVALTVLLLALACAICVARADADTTSEYGEVARFGGFDEGDFDRGKYDGRPTPGEFVDPTGFAVDPEEEDDVYVADRVSNPFSEPTVWRIQKLSPSHCALEVVPAPVGCVLGTTLFTLPNDSALAGIAVDHRAGRLYALVIGPPSAFSEFPNQSVAQELLAWSTTPNDAGGLVAATDSGGGRLPSDPLSSETPEGAEAYQATVGGLVSSQAQLQPYEGSRPTAAAERAWLFEPQGIAIDRLEAPGVDNPVVIEASDLQVANGGPISGNTIVQQVATQSQPGGPQAAGVSTGQPLARWSSADAPEAVKAMDGSWGPGGIFDNPDGSLSVILKAASGSVPESYVVRLSPEFAQASVLNPLPSNPPFEALREEPMLLEEEPPFGAAGGRGISTQIATAGPETAQLSTAESSSADGLYAAVFVHTYSSQESWYWSERGSPSYHANVGVRLLRPTATGEIADRHGETITNTLGNAAHLAACNIGAEEAALAAGSDGTLWIFDRGPRSNAENLPTSGVVLGRQIIELAPASEFKPGTELEPGYGRLCPQPSGTFTMTGSEDSVQAGAAPLEVPVGTEVTFNGGTIELQNGWPFSWEWEVVGAGVHARVVNREEKTTLFRPSPLYKYTFARPGSYTVRAKVLSDYGAYTPPLGTVVVKGLEGGLRPQAAFTTEPVQGTQQVVFNASKSSPGEGTVVGYIWSWGDGSALESDGPTTPVVTHTYQQAGTYNVKLTVVNSLYQASTSAPQEVTVVAPPAPVSEAPLSGPIYEIPLSSTSNTASTGTATQPGPDRSATDVSPRARFVHGAVAVELTCPASKQRCAGTVRVETAAALAAGTGGKRRGRGAQRLVLGSASFALPGGRAETVGVALGQRGKALLRTRGRLAVLVIVAAHDQLGDPYSGTVRLTLARTVASSNRPRAAVGRHGAGGR
jgi:PKD repeat protein